MTSLLYSIHDRDAHPIIPAGGWCVDAVLATDTPPDYAAMRSDINWIVRLNHGWNPNGTIPVRAGYPEYAQRCADFVARSRGVDWFILSNEPNHIQEQAHGIPIAPEDYADCFNLCYQAIKQVRPTARVLTAAVAPWDISSGMDWLVYYRRMLDAIHDCSGLAVHGYVHGADPDLIWSQEKTHGWFWHFPVIYQTIEAIPAKFAHLPVHVTETNQGDNAWLDRNSGWVQSAYHSIDDHNQQAAQKILSLSLYRWRGDKWEIHNKQGVQDDFQAAVQQGYQSPEPGTPLPIPPLPEAPPWIPDPPEPAPAPEPTEWDARLTLRGVTLTPATVGVGEYAWHVVEGIFYPWGEGPTDAQGRRNNYVEVCGADGQRAIGTPITHWWTTGRDTKPAENKRDPWMTAQGKDGYALDFPFGATWPSYGVMIEDGTPSDEVWGLGYGDALNPNHHTASYFRFVRVREGVDQPPPIDIPQPPILLPSASLVHPLPGAVITQNFYQGDYTRFGSNDGHNGCDMGGKPEGEPVRAMADGVVAFVGHDETGYGNYVRASMTGLNAYAFFCHLSEIKCAVGQALKAGDVVGLLGSTGFSTGVHLHLEIRLCNPDGSYREDTPMPRGRVDPRTWAAMYHLKL